MFEHVKQEVLSFKCFLLRLIKFFCIASIILFLGLVPGFLGFHYVAGLDFHEAMLNTLSLLGDISPPYRVENKPGQLFSAIYGLFIETVFLLSVATLLSPIIHRILHRLHIDTAAE